MTKYEILHAALDLDEYERKQIILVLTASMLTNLAIKEFLDVIDVDKEDAA